MKPRPQPLLFEYQHLLLWSVRSACAVRVQSARVRCVCGACARQHLQLIGPGLCGEACGLLLGKAQAERLHLRPAALGRAAPPRAQLEQLGVRAYHVQPSVATTGEGLWQGLKWLAANVKKL